MHSFPSPSKTENKRLALEQLRFSKARQSNRVQVSSTSSSTSSDPTSQPHHRNVPPAQSRDASGPSRFFPTSNSSPPKVLVPSSSPLSNGSSSSRLYQTATSPQNQPVASSSNLSNGNLWARSNLGSDPLIAPSGFVSKGGSRYASSRRPEYDDELSNHEEGPPRKKINRGRSEDASSILDSPPSPEIQRMGERRHISAISADSMSISSEDSLPDPARIVAGPSKPRLTKSRPSPSPDVVPSTPESDDKKRFNIFMMTYPGGDPVKLRAAWTQANGDKNKADALFNDPTWSPSSLYSVSEKEILGRVKEIDDANKAQRAADKEKGKKSMIYANRTNIESKPPSTPPSTRPVIDLTIVSTPNPPSPLTPIIQPQRRRIKKLVIDSDDEVLSGASDGEKRKTNEAPSGSTYQKRALDYLNTSGSDALQELTGCTPEQAQAIIGLRPFYSPEDIRTKLGQGKKKAGPTGISPRMFEDCTNMLEGYGSVDNILESCEKIGSTLRATIDSWTPGKVHVNEETSDDGAISLVSLNSLKNRKAQNYLTTQPKSLPDNIVLKEYQLLGVNWLNLLYASGLSCILADEMGLGKTIQVISFLAYLKEQGKTGPHLIVVPSSTLENWCREFVRFAPSIAVQTYYADKNERPFLRDTLLKSQKCRGSADGWEVLITTYNLAQNDHDRKFFRKIQWDCCVYDEGHLLKNFQSQRYDHLLKVGSNWRLLLTGTPLQNNLQELVSLMNFILPDQFAGSLENLRTIFKVKGDTKVTLLSQERISRAKKMMTPFVLRRRKDQVLRDLPKKTERIEWCELTDLQRNIYRDTLQRSRKTIFDEEDEGSNSSSTKHSKKKAWPNPRPKEKPYAENSTNVLMDLRKAASHPMLFRTRFTDDILSHITKLLLKEPDYKKRGALYDFVKEDMSVMTDSELQVFCATYKSTRKYLQDQSCYADAGKVQVLLGLLERYRKESRKILIFSQFTQILDILQAVLKAQHIKYQVLTGSTPVDVRQTLVDEFTDDESIPVFLLSTKAGGMGINLTAASVVIMFDQDFNPHNDRQAQDRAYRIGQKRDVEVVKLISRGTIEEDMLRLGETKLALDEAVAGDGEGNEGNAPEREMKVSLLKSLRQQYETKDVEMI